MSESVYRACDPEHLRASQTCYCLELPSLPSDTPGPDIVKIDRLKTFLGSMGCGAWPFLVGGVICLVNSVNERDLDLLNSSACSMIRT